MSKLTDEQKRDIYGKPATDAAYQPGDCITFKDPQTGGIKTGEILYAVAPRMSRGTGTIHSTQYFVDCGDGFPSVVLAADIIEKERED